MGHHNFAIIKNGYRISIDFPIIIKINFESLLNYRNCFYNISSAGFKFCKRRCYGFVFVYFAEFLKGIFCCCSLFTIGGLIGACGLFTKGLLLTTGFGGFGFVVIAGLLLAFGGMYFGFGVNRFLFRTVLTVSFGGLNFQRSSAYNSS